MKQAVENELSIDHLVYATPDVDRTVEELAERLGVRASAGGRHPGFGTRNALLDLGGGAYLEIIGVDPEAAAPPEGRRPFGVDRIEVPRLVTWAAQAVGIEACVGRARERGHDPGPVQAMSRQRPDGVELHWQLTPTSGEGVELLPFLIEWGDGVAHPSTTSASGCRLVSFSGEHPDPQTVTAALRALGVELVVKPAAAAALIAVIEGPAGTVELR
jgi:hypothetical protein